MLPIVVLAGGLATRLRPVTEKIPKSLIEINGIPFILYQLQLFYEKGFTHIHFCLGFLGEKVEDQIKKSKYYDLINITFSYDGDKLLGTGGAIKNIVDQLPYNFFITYGDSYLDISYSEIEQYYNSYGLADEKSLMTVFKNNGKWDQSNVVFENGKISLYSKLQKNPKMEYIDYGVGILCKIDFEDYAKASNFDLCSLYEKKSISNDLLGYEIYERFYEIGSFAGINDFSEYIKTKK
jgi:N-acetyl-alpha-D-muramate 1-phosphate uridylyltransferase